MKIKTIDAEIDIPVYKPITVQNLFEKLNKFLKLNNPDLYKNRRKIVNMDTLVKDGDILTLVNNEHI